MAFVAESLETGERAIVLTAALSPPLSPGRPKRGYSEGERRSVLETADELGVAEASRLWGPDAATIYRWRREIRAR